MCEICSKLTIKTPEQLSTVFVVNFGHISHLSLVFLLLLWTSYAYWVPPDQFINAEVEVKKS